jgi:hypothetical protein
MADERRSEPWPWILAGLLLAMIATCLAFWWIAASHPDARVYAHPLAGAAPGGPRPAE